MDIFQKNQLTYTVDVHPDLILGITGRHGGKSMYPNEALNMARYIDDHPEHISFHQKLVAEEIQFPTERWVFPIQTHGNTVTEVSQLQTGTNIDVLTDELHSVDGLFTYDKNVLLTMCYADCVPVYLYDTDRTFCALLHAGWRGTVGEIVKKGIKTYKGDKKQLKMITGPSVCSECYHVNEDIKSKFDKLGYNTDHAFNKKGDVYEINLQEINKVIALEAGLLDQNIQISKRCTSKEVDAFFSYRLEKGNTGRMMAFIGMRE